MMLGLHPLARRVVLLACGHEPPNLRIARHDNVRSRSSRLVALSLDVAILAARIRPMPLLPWTRQQVDGPARQLVARSRSSSNSLGSQLKPPTSLNGRLLAPILSPIGPRPPGLRLSGRRRRQFGGIIRGLMLQHRRQTRPGTIGEFRISTRFRLPRSHRQSQIRFRLRLMLYLQLPLRG